MATRAELRDDCELRIQDVDNVIATDDQINQWINTAIREIARYHPWPFMKTRVTLALSANAETADLPDDCRAVTKVTRLDGDARVPLVPIADRWMQHNLLSTTAGTPYYYTDGGFKQTSASSPPKRVLRVAPKAESAATLEVAYLRRGMALTSDGQYPPFPEEFDEAIRLWVMRQYWRQVDAPESVTGLDKEWEDEMQRLKSSEFGSETVEGYPRVMADWDIEDW